MAKALSAVRRRKGLSLYRIANSTKWYVRVWGKKRKKYLVKSTGVDTVIHSREAAKDLALSQLKAENPFERVLTF